MGKTKEQKPSILRWRGVLAAYTVRFRVLAAAVLAVACAAFAFTQLGFVEVPLPGDASAYAVVMLQPIALSALLLGILPGLCIGLFAGCMLYASTIFIPVDYYTFTYVTPFSSVVMLGASGLLLGLLFAIALRRNPSPVRRVVYIAIVCFIVATLYSQAFFLSVLVSMVMQVVTSTVTVSDASQLSPALVSKLTSMAADFGDAGVQTIVDALLMALFCCIGDVVSRKAVVLQRNRSIRVLFNAWLSVVVLLAFMVTATIVFGTISNNEYLEAQKDADRVVSYLCNQLAASKARDDAFRRLVDRHNLENVLGDKDTDDLLTLFEEKNILDGYTPEEDGIVFVTMHDSDYIFMSDSEMLPESTFVEKQLDSSISEGIKRSIAQGTFERVVFTGVADYSFEDIIGGLNNGTASGDKSGAGSTEGAAAGSQDASLPLTQVADSISGELYYLRAGVTGKSTLDYQVVLMRPASAVFAERTAEMARTTASVLVLLLFVFGMTAWLLGRVVVRRIDETNGVLARITEGDLNATVKVGDTNEFASLSDGINSTVVALKGWIAEAETRMDAELATAKAIQEAALPRLFPPYPDILRFDIYALMQAAKEVGGDFYDFFLIGDDCNPDSGKLGFVIADVSGKGVPAALFMMKAKTQIRDYMESGMELGEAIENANRQLCDGNDAGMFVTVFAGVLDYAQNSVEFVNAGHNPPLLWQTDGWSWVKEKSGLPLGLFDGLPYRAHHIDCTIGDQFILYTDGVTEAMNTDGALYGEGRLEAIAAQNYPLHPRALANRIRQDVAAHANGALQSDDITILTLEVGVPPEITSILTVDAKVEELPRVNAFVHEELDRRLCPLRAQNQLDIAVEELFVNVARYAYPQATPDNPGTVQIGYTYSADPPSLTVDMVDSGVAFDPLAKPDAVTPDDIMEVPIGGLGILMAKRSVDEMRYERVDDTNVVTIVKKW